LPLSDPFIVLQSVLAGHPAEAAAWGGALLVAAGLALTAGRLYCSWVCPINLLADLAAGLRRGLGLGQRRMLAIDRRTRHCVLALALLASLATGTIAWEMVNPITLLQRGLVFGIGAASVLAAAAVFSFDLLVARGGWCGHLCPVGAFYGWLGRWGRLRVAAPRAAACTQCGACYRVCPEPHVLVPVLRPGERCGSLAVRHQDCLRCGRCIDVCDERVFVMRLAR
jgi:ferredoxin-type protein NapH